MTPASNEVAAPPPRSPSSWLWLWRAFSMIPSFEFMVHDRWANALFLHWRVPLHLESTLEENTAPFRLDRYDGSAWIGLILLTEENVGPSVGRTKWTCVTHHGINVRTYVTGLDGAVAEPPSQRDGTDKQRQQPGQSRGIHFSSLECDDEFTSVGANVFGMPYRIATIMRSYGWSRKCCDETVEPSPSKGTQTKGPSSSHESQSSSSANRYYYRMRSERLRVCAPSLVRVVVRAVQWCGSKILHSIIAPRAAILTSEDPNDRDSEPEDSTPQSTVHSETRDAPPLPTPSSPPGSQTFTVDCVWSRSSCNDDEDANSHRDAAGDDPGDGDRSFSEWACERYLVYTQKYGTQWRGRVDHETWPMVPVRLETLSLSGVNDSYEPEAMRPLLSHMATTRPDRVGFSPGVGPVRFQMLQPLM